jgi:primosomal replication protein N
MEAGTVSNPCRKSPPAPVTYSETSPQLSYTFRFREVSSNLTLYPEVLRAVMWWSHVADPSVIELTKIEQMESSTWAVTVLIGTSSRQEAVAMMRLLDRAVLSGDFLKFIQNKVEVGSVIVVESRLTSARETGVTFAFPTSAADPLTEKCDRVTIDTGGCDEIFTLKTPYADNEQITLTSPDGNVPVHKACNDGKSFATAQFPSGKRGSVVLVDSRYVDADRSVPHILAALPEEASPHSAISLDHSPEQWEASLQSKAWLVIPKLHGPMTGPPLLDAHIAIIRTFVEAGGNVLVAGSPIRGAAWLNRVFGWTLTDVAPQMGGMVFLPGSVSLKYSDEFSASVLNSCTASWTNQNSFSFLSHSSLPLKARSLYRDGERVAVVDIPYVQPSQGHVLYFAFDFFDAPSDDTACILRHSLAFQYSQ